MSSPPTPLPLAQILSQAVRRLAPCYPKHRFVLMGYPPDGDAREVVQVPCVEAREDTGPPLTLDSLTEMLRDVMAARMPGCEWASVVFHQPGRPNVVLVVSPRTASGLPAELPRSAPSAPESA